MNKSDNNSKIDLEPIEGFKVMEWLRKVREEDYKLRKEDPKQYATEMEEIEKELEERLRHRGRTKNSP